MTIFFLFLLYYFVSRIILTVGLTLIKTPAIFYCFIHMNAVYEDKFLNKEERNTFLLPVIGEIALLVSVYVLLFHYPMQYIGNKAEHFRNSIEQKKQLNDQRHELILKYGLSEKDIPKFINTQQALKEYLSVYAKESVNKY